MGSTLRRGADNNPRVPGDAGQRGVHLIELWSISLSMSFLPCPRRSIMILGNTNWIRISGSKNYEEGGGVEY